MPTSAVGVQGEDVLVSVMSADATPVALVIEHQGDLTYNPGVSQNKTRTKTGNVPWRSKEGATATMSIVKLRPLSAGQQRLWDLAASGDLEEFTIDDPNVGGHKRVGIAQVSMGEEASNVEGLVQVPFTIAFINDPTETVNT